MQPNIFHSFRIVYQLSTVVFSRASTSHIGDPDKAWSLQKVHHQRRHPEWPCDFRRSGPSDQPCGSPKLRRSFSWPASAARGPSFPHYLAAGPPVRRRTRGHHHLSARTRPLHHAEDWACEATVPLRESNGEAGRRAFCVARCTKGLLHLGPCCQRSKVSRHTVTPVTQWIQRIWSQSSASIWPASDQFQQHATPPQPHLCTATSRSAHMSSSVRTQCARLWSPPTAAPTRSCHGERRHCNSLCAGGPSLCQPTGSSQPTCSVGPTAGTTASAHQSTQPRP
jgi:hypothetical protein